MWASVYGGWFSPMLDQREAFVNREAMTFAAVAPVPVAVLMVGDNGLATSPTANTKGTVVSCSLVTAM